MRVAVEGFDEARGTGGRTSTTNPANPADRARPVTSHATAYAGDACLGGWVEDALASGLAAARALLGA